MALRKFFWISKMFIIPPSPQAEFDASELITQREVVSQRVSELLMERGETFGLILDDISIVSCSITILMVRQCMLKQKAYRIVGKFHGQAGLYENWYL